MTNKKQVKINDGYVPKSNEKGYQPEQQPVQPSGDPNPQSGYVPTGSGDNPTNDPTPPDPTPPGDE